MTTEKQLFDPGQERESTVLPSLGNAMEKGRATIANRIRGVILDLKTPEIYNTINKNETTREAVIEVLVDDYLTTAEERDSFDTFCSRLRPLLHYYLGIDKVLECLFMLARKTPLLQNSPEQVTNHQLAQLFYEHYRESGDALNPTYSYHRYEHIEASVILTLASTRTSLRQICSPTPSISRLIEKADAYYQQAFQTLFKKAAPISLVDVTRVTSVNYGSPWADRISGLSFIPHFWFERELQTSEGDRMIHIIIHEGLHLSFPGFNYNSAEEALVEVIAEKMRRAVPTDFKFEDQSDYIGLRNGLSTLLQAIPPLQSILFDFFVEGDIDKLNNRMDELLSGWEVRHQIYEAKESGANISSCHAFLEFLKKFKLL